MGGVSSHRGCQPAVRQRLVPRDGCFSEQCRERKPDPKALGAFLVVSELWRGKAGDNPLSRAAALGSGDTQAQTAPALIGTLSSVLPATLGSLSNVSRQVLSHRPLLNCHSHYKLSSSEAHSITSASPREALDP